MEIPSEIGVRLSCRSSSSPRRRDENAAFVIIATKLPYLINNSPTCSGASTFLPERLSISDNPEVGGLDPPSCVYLGPRFNMVRAGKRKLQKIQGVMPKSC